MSKCEHCGIEVVLPFECNFCGGKFCIEHRLPENHECSNVPKKLLSYSSPIAENRTESREKPKTGKPFPVKKAIGLVLGAIIIGALLWYTPTIISYIQNLSSQYPTNPSDGSYISLTFRDMMNDTATIEFGDTEYTFYYSGVISGDILDVWTFIGGSNLYTLHKGDIYRDFGIEIKVSDLNSDYVSKYVVILIKPTVQNYSASLHYTKVSIALHETKAVNISSGLINKTDQYWFSYNQIPHPSFYEAQLTIRNASQSKSYVFLGAGGETIKDFDIEIKVYKIESKYMIIYVKPLY